MKWITEYYYPELDDIPWAFKVEGYSGEIKVCTVDPSSADYQPCPVTVPQVMEYAEKEWESWKTKAGLK